MSDLLTNQQLYEYTAGAVVNQEPLLYTEQSPTGSLDFLGRIARALKYPLRDGLEEVLRKYYAETRLKLNCYLPMGDGGNDPFKELWRAGRIDNFPNIAVTMVGDSLSKKKFIDQLVAPGYFQACQPQPVSELFTESGIVDPGGAFSVFAVNPYLFLIDHQQLAGLPTPRRWSDLLNPIYRDRIIVGGWKTKVDKILLLNIYREHGLEGIKSLAANVKHIWHNATSAKTAGSGDPAGAGIYILPWFMARICFRRVETTIVWPDDGALAVPMFMLVKKSHLTTLEVLINYITGPEFGAVLAKNNYPPLNPMVKQALPPNAKFKWLGWDYFRSNDISELIKLCTGAFLEVYQAKQ